MATPSPVTTQVVALAEQLNDGLRRFLERDGALDRDEQRLLDLHAVLHAKALKADRRRRKAIAVLNGADVDGPYQRLLDEEMQRVEALAVAQLLDYLPTENEEAA